MADKYFYTSNILRHNIFSLKTHKTSHLLFFILKSIHIFFNVFSESISNKTIPGLDKTFLREASFFTKPLFPPLGVNVLTQKKTISFNKAVIIGIFVISFYSDKSIHFKTKKKI